MSDRPHIYIPVRSFSSGMKRLAEAIAPDVRHRLARALARHTITQAIAVSSVTIVSSDPEAVQLADDMGVGCVADPQSGLDGAARLATEQSSSWAVLHADLPLLSTSDLAALLAPERSDPVVAPSYDGGTTAVRGRGDFPFAYGPASAGRHLRHASEALVRTGFLLDIDRPDDLHAAARHPRGAWLNAIIES